MHLVQILLPTHDNEGNAFGAELFKAVQDELTERFGGLTAYSRSPAEGLWQDEGAATTRDDIVVVEVMAAELDAEWWRGYRAELERRFRQKEMIVRAIGVTAL
jgi:hypothetical protein